MFARWESEEACLKELGLYHAIEDAKVIIAMIKDRVKNNTLFKSFPEEMEIIKINDEIIVYGICSWEKVDPQNDVVTTQFMTSFFDKLFNNVEERYQNCMVDHKNFQGGIPLRKWTHPETGKTYYTHVHEKGAMLVSKVRDDDGLTITQQFRELVLAGIYKSYSISGRPLNTTRKMIDGREINFRVDGEPIEITYCKRGMMDVAKFDVISKTNDIYYFEDPNKSDEEPEEDESEEDRDEDKPRIPSEKMVDKFSHLTPEEVKDKLDMLKLCKKHGLEL